MVCVFDYQVRVWMVLCWLARLCPGKVGWSVGRVAGRLAGWYGVAVGRCAHGRVRDGVPDEGSVGMTE